MKTDYAAIRTSLEERLRELASRTKEIEEDLSAPGDTDWDESAIESEGDEVLEGVGRATVQEMRQIRAALAAIGAGKYGTCSDCKAKISPERLEALPEATRCQRCA